MSFTLDDNKNWTQIWRDYVEASKDAGLRFMQYSTFTKYRAAYCSDIYLSSPKQDECDTCFNFLLIVNDPRSTQEQKDLAKMGLSTHQEFAKEQRLASKLMTDFIKNYANEYKGNQAVNCNLNLGFIPVTVEETIEEVFARLDLNGEGRLLNETCPVLFEMQDFGGNLTIPHFGFKRPSIDYYTSNLLMHMFVISDITHAINNVILYDERVWEKVLTRYVLYDGFIITR